MPRRSISAEPADRPALDTFDIPLGADPVDTPDCAIPEEGDRHRTFGVTSPDDTFIAGRLVLPSGAGSFPTVVVNAGSGGIDRTGKYNPLRFWDCAAAELTSRGIAVVSYDDRGWGESGGFATDSYIGRDGDAEVVAAWAAAQPEIGSLFLLGHSQGGAHISAAAPLVPEVDGLIYAAAVGTDPLSELRALQLAAWLTAVGANQDYIDTSVAVFETWVADVLAGVYDGEWINGQPVDTYIKPTLLSEPLSLALATTGPVLIVQGALDWQVPPDNADWLATALIEAGRDVTVYEDPDLGHFFQPAVDGLAVGNEYGLPWAFDPGVWDAVADFVLDKASSAP